MGSGNGRQADPQREGRLFVVGTPIGNLGDFAPRAQRAFSEADAILCEDTRVTSKLLAHLGISKTLLRCDENVIASRAPELTDRMLAGETFAFASDAGMPSVSDPGQVLVDAAREAGVPVEVVPGPSACVTALVASGIPCDHFFFEGFLPRKHGERVRRLGELAHVPGALIFYESPHRAEASCEAIAEVFPARTVALCRELTKLHAEVLRAPAAELVEGGAGAPRRRGPNRPPRGARCGHRPRSRGRRARGEGRQAPVAEVLDAQARGIRTRRGAAGIASPRHARPCACGTMGSCLNRLRASKS